MIRERSNAHDETLRILAIGIPAIITAVAALVTAWRTGSKIDKVHVDINSRVDQLITETGKASLAQGVAQGIQQNKDEATSDASKKPK